MVEGGAITSQNPYTEEVQITTSVLLWTRTQSTGSYLERLPGFIRDGKWEQASVRIAG